MNLRELVRLNEGVLSPRIFADPQIHALEQERVFSKAWLFLGHESQIPEPGDFFSTYMAEDPVFMVRQRDGSIAAFLNQCRHRGMRVCRADRGNAKGFMCAYHGWTYDMEGRLKGLPHEEQYSAIDKSAWGLTPVTRVETYKGMVFGNWDAGAVPLAEYLGPAAAYVDGLVDRLEGGTEVIGGVHKWVINCNWKMPAEQFVNDMYHAAFSHISALEACRPDDYEASRHSMATRGGVQFWTDRGHGGGYFISDRPNPAVWLDPLAKAWLQDTYEEAKVRIGHHLAARVSGHNTLFPNFSWLNGTNTIRVWHPRGHDQIEVWAWVLVDKKAPPDVKEAFRRSALRAFGPSGMLEQDDGENWVEIQKIVQGPVARKSRFCYGMALGDGEVDCAEGPKTHHGPLFSDKAALNFYQRWLEMMEAQ